MSSIEVSCINQEVGASINDSFGDHIIQGNPKWGRVALLTVHVRSLLKMSMYMVLNVLTLGKILVPEVVPGYLHLPAYKTFMYTPINPFMTNQNGRDVTYKLKSTKWWFDLGKVDSLFTLATRTMLTCLIVVNQVLAILLSWLNMAGKRIPTIKSVFKSDKHILIKLIIGYYLVILNMIYFNIVVMVTIALLNISLCGMVISSFHGSNSASYPASKFLGMRRKFRKLNIEVSDDDYGAHHGHADEAKLRASADDTINEFITSNKGSVYSIQKSGRDVQNKINGSLDLRILLDAHHGVVGTDVIDKNAIFKLINVDYYINWLDYLWLDRPFIMYTATPKLLTGVAGAMRWTITPENKLRMSIDGGASYEHEVWDYSIDNIQVEYPGISILYYVDTIRLDENWSIVMLMPYHRSYSPTLVPKCTLRRKQYIHSVKTLYTLHLDKVTLRRNVIDVALQYSNHSTGVLQIARPNDYITTTVDPSVAAYIKAAAMARGGMEEHSVFTGVVNKYLTDARTSATLIYVNFPLDDVNIQTNVTPYKLTDADVNYNMPTDARDGPNPSCKNVATVIGPVVMLGGVAACESKVNDEAAVRKRIQDTSDPNKKLPSTWLKFLNEFNKLIVRDKLVPATMDMIRDMIKTNLKLEKFEKALPERASFMEAMECKITSFQKKESYNEPKDPRNISTLPTEHYIGMSQYTLPVAKHLKMFADWYAFGKHPDDVAMRMLKVCSHAKAVAETDFSRFDGTHTYSMYEAEELFMKHCYSTEFHDQISKMYTLLKTSSAVTRHGVVYDLLGTRASGGADTSVGNTYMNAAFNYVVFRLNGEEPGQAMAHLGVYGGDDGVTPDPYPNTESLAKEANLRLKLSVKVPENTVTMLARLYPFIWTKPNHCCDPIRNIPRLHVSVKGSEVTNVQELINRATGYLVTDPFTAVIADWSRAVLRVHDVKGEVTTYSAMQYELKNTYCLSFEETVPIVATQCGVTVERIRMYCNELKDIKTVIQFNNLGPLVPLDLSDVKRTEAKVNIGDILHPVDAKLRALKPKPVSLMDFKVPAGFELCVPSPLDQGPINRFYRLVALIKPQRFIDMTAGVGIDSAIASGVFRCPKFACENDIVRFAALKQNLRNHANITVKFVDSRLMQFAKGDLVMLDPMWPAGKATLRFDNMPVDKYIKTKLLPLGVDVMLRTPVSYQFGWQATPVVVRRDTTGKKKAVYKLYHLRSSVELSV